MTKEVIAQMREEVKRMEFQIQKAEFIENLQSLNATFTEKPILLDEVQRLNFYQWNQAASRIMRDIEKEQVLGENGEQSKDIFDTLFQK
jgi:prenyltransferase beta subunit